MRNFLIAFLVFLVWSFFGLWLYSWLNPTPNGTQANNGLIDTVNLDPDTNDLLRYGNETIDTLVIDEAYKREFIDAPTSPMV